MKDNSRIIISIFIFILALPLVYKYGIKFTNNEFIDLPSFYYASRATFDARHSPYDYNALSGLAPDEKIFPFLYPPPALLVFYPLSWLTYGQAKILMLFLSHASFLLALYLLLFKIIKLNTREGLVYLLLIYSFMFQPMYLTLALGQVNLILLVLISLFWYSYEHKLRDYLTAIPITLAILLKTYPVLFLIYFLIKRKYGLLYWTSGFLVFAAALSWIALPGGTWSDWLTHVLPSGGVGEIPYNLFHPAAPWNLSINGFVSRLFFPNDFSAVFLPSVGITKLAGYLLIVSVLAVTFRAIFLQREDVTSTTTGKEICLILLASYLVAPLSWEHHLVFLLPCVFMIYHELFSRKIDIFSIVLICFSLILARDIPVESAFFKQGIRVLAISAKFYCVVLLWLYFLWSLFRRTPNTRTQQHEFSTMTER